MTPPLHFPNGWPVPTFMGLAQDGEFYAEWCFGQQGAMDSWRVSLHTNTADGKTPFVIFTKRPIESCRIVEGMEAMEFLEATLRPMSNTDVDGNPLSGQRPTS